MTRYFIFLFILLFSFPSCIFAQNYTVSTKSNLLSKMTSAMPGDTVTVTNGTYSWGDISFNNTHGDSSSAWIVLKAETPNGVIFSGNTYLQFGGYRIMVTGFKFANGNSGKNDVIQFTADATQTNNAFYCRLNNITIDTYDSDTTGESQGKDVHNSWVALYGAHNRIDHCTFINKYNGEPTVVVWYDSTNTNNYPNPVNPTYHLIDSNYFNFRGWLGGNGGETIRIGLGSVSNTNGYNVVQYNLFQYGVSTDPEIISNKSNCNTIRYNTLKDLTGGISLRQGRYNSVYGNFIFNSTYLTNTISKNNITAQYGIRLIDKGQYVYNNYIEGIDCNYSKLNTSPTPIIIYSGQAPGEGLTIPIPGYYSADSSVVAFNTIVNCYGGAGMQIGYPHADKDSIAPYKPQGLIIANNIIKMSKGQAIAVDTSTNPLILDTTSLGTVIPDTLPVKYFAEGNVYNAPSKLGITNSTGFTSKTLTFGARTNSILPPPTLVTGAAVNSKNYDSLLNGLDALGRIRTSPFAVGAIDPNATGPVIYGPLDSTMVGAGTPIVPLPVSIISFTGILDDGNVHLKWEVVNEINIEHYEVEYSNDGNSFTSVGQLPAQNKAVYGYTTKLGNMQNSYYRLKIVSKDGSVTYTNTVLISSSNEKICLSLYPNPVRGNLTIAASHIKPNSLVAIVDFLGRIIRTETIQNGMNPLNVDWLRSGTYYISTLENGKLGSGVPFIVQQ